MIKIKEIIQHLETIAPPIYQEGYDNSGLIVGDANAEATGVLVSLDCIESIVDEAIEKGCNLIVAHHPIVFKGLKRFNGRNYVERTVMKAIKHDIAIYAIHTNLDNMYYHGVNTKIAEVLGLKNTKILAPKSQVLRSLVTFAPAEHAEKIREALFAAGAGQIGNYDQCSFNAIGFGTFRANEKANPFVGEQGVQHREAESRIEVIFPLHAEAKVMSALRASHPYEEIAYYLFAIENANQEIGSGMIGELEKPMQMLDFLKLVKKTMHCGAIRYTALPEGKKVSKVAVCGGAGGFLLGKAIGQGADVFVTADYKYHEFFDADGKIVIADIGHFESEQYTISLISDIISKKFITFAVYLTEVNTNPINYL
jgi:dinuclear metal center YbgI/SA1388 family protein